MEIGDKVRPVGGHIARSHIGTVEEFTTPYVCRTCGTTLYKMARVRWADGRVGDWTPESLEVVVDAVQ